MNATKKRIHSRDFVPFHLLQEVHAARKQAAMKGKKVSEIQKPVKHVRKDSRPILNIQHFVARNKQGDPVEVHPLKRPEHYSQARVVAVYDGGGSVQVSSGDIWHCRQSGKGFITVAYSA